MSEPNETARRFVLVQILAPLIVQTLVGVGAASIAIMTFNVRLEERIAHIEMRATEHDSKIELLRTRSEEQGRQLARFEAAIADITEIKADVKQLLLDRIPK